MPPETPEDDEIKVLVVDDTPPADRNRSPLPENIVEELDKDDLEEYSDKVKTRISQMKKVWHDERRAKESATREREEALHFARNTYQENQALKQRLGAGERVFISEVNKSASNDLLSAKTALKQAQESGDADKISDALDTFTDAKLKVREVEKFRPSLQEQESGVQPVYQAPQPQSSPQPDQKAEAWQEKNTWFGRNKSMTALALGLHDELLDAGLDPRSDEYYRRVDTTMRKRFPENFSEESDTDEASKPTRRNSTVVAPATRSTSSKQIRITASEAAIAKRLGLTPEAYAREKIKLENNNV
ncbi:MAG: hypothetical protein WCO52_06065 [bacterium]